MATQAKWTQQQLVFLLDSVKADWTDSSTDSGIKLNRPLFTTQRELYTKWGEWSGAPGIHGQEGEWCSTLACWSTCHSFQSLHTRSALVIQFAPHYHSTPHCQTLTLRKKGYRKGPGNLWRKKTKDDQNQETTRKNTRRDESRVTPMCEKQQFSDEKLWATALAREGRIMSQRCSPAQWGYEVQNEVRGQKLLNLFKNCQCINEIKEFPSKKCNLKQLKTVKRVNNFVQNAGSDYNLFKM